MKEKPSYLWKAFTAKSWGMPIPLHWFGIAAFGVLGAFVDPGLWLVGLGLEGLYLWTLSRNARFRNVIDAQEGATDSSSRYEDLLAQLDTESQGHQYEIEREAAEIVALLQRSQGHDSQIGDVRQMAWLHLKLLTARASFLEVVEVASSERRKLEDQERRARERLASLGDDEELKRSLEQQIEVIRSRHAAHADAKRRGELVEAELARLRQQVSLVREQALLSTDHNNIAQSLDALSASLNEANKWLRDQRELFAGLDTFNDEPPPADLLAARRVDTRSTRRSGKVSE
jgi:hypothetical protein